MGTPYYAELRIVSFNFAPRGWAFCNGQLLPINQNQALFSLLGTTYGGNGVTNFALPNLQGRVALGGLGTHQLGEQGGEASHTLSLAELPTHAHGALPASSVRASLDSAQNAVWASGPSMYAKAAPNGTMSPAAVTNVGGGQPHNNEQPYLTLNVVIALQGIFPSRN